MSISKRRDKRGLVLIADDDAATRLMVRAALEQSGFAVAEADNGVQAISAFERHNPEIVLLDVVMPMMDGFEACSAIRKLPNGSEVPILMLTGLDDIESINKAYEVGATDFATKPVNWIVLSHRVRYMLRAKYAADELRESKARLASAQRRARLGNCEWDLESNKVTRSEEIYRLLGIPMSEGEITNEKFHQFVHPEDRDPVIRAFEDTLNNHAPYSMDFRIIQRDGKIRFAHQQIETVFDDHGKAVRLTGTIQDITERRQAEDQIRFLAYYDNLTQLPNRLLFRERLDYALTRARRETTQVAILFLDLDRFKQINDTLGHSTGDSLLEAVATRLQECVRGIDPVTRNVPVETHNTLARLGGDEFIIALGDITQIEDAAKVARRILTALKDPFRLDNNEVFVSSSIGISVFPDDGDNAEALLMNADAAMYHAKDEGRNNYQFYNTSMNEAAFAKLSLENDLRKAVERNELVLYYQPQIDIRSGNIISMEALLRWQHPERGLISPMEFIPLAEETGLIVPIGAWVLQAACVQTKAWHDAGHTMLSVAVNLSGRQFRENGLIQMVEQVLNDSGLDPEHLELEITESIIMQNAESTINTLNDLKAMGVKLSIDDFGTGYSSLSYLKRFPIDTLKIDRSFVRDITNEEEDEAITKAIIVMAQSLKLSVVAEGVETEQQLAILRKQGCPITQGYLFSKPIPAEQFLLLLEQHATSNKPLEIRSV